MSVILWQSVLVVEKPQLCPSHCKVISIIRW